VRVVDAALNGREGPAFARKLDAGLHGNVAHVLHHLRGEILAGRGAVANIDVVHQVGQAHDAQSDAAGAQGGLAELRHCGHVGIGVDHVIQKADGELH